MQFRYITILLLSACAGEPALESAEYCVPGTPGRPSTPRPVDLGDPANPQGPRHDHIVALTFSNGRPRDIQGAKAALDAVPSIPATFFVRPDQAFGEGDAGASAAASLRESGHLLAPTLDVPSDWSASELRTALRGQNEELSRDAAIAGLRDDLNRKVERLGALGLLEPAGALLYRHVTAESNCQLQLGGDEDDSWVPGDSDEPNQFGSFEDDDVSRLARTAVLWHISTGHIIARARKLEPALANESAFAIAETETFIEAAKELLAEHGNRAIVMLESHYFNIGAPARVENLKKLLQELRSPVLAGDGQEARPGYNFVRIDDPRYFSLVELDNGPDGQLFRGFAALIADKTVRIPAEGFSFDEHSRQHMPLPVPDMRGRTSIHGGTLAEGSSRYAFAAVTVDHARPDEARIELLRGASDQQMPDFETHAPKWQAGGFRVHRNDIASAASCALDGDALEIPQGICPLENAPARSSEHRYQTYLGRNIEGTSWMLAAQDMIASPAPGAGELDARSGRVSWEFIVVDPSFGSSDVARPIVAVPFGPEIFLGTSSLHRISLHAFEIQGTLDALPIIGDLVKRPSQVAQAELVIHLGDGNTMSAQDLRDKLRFHLERDGNVRTLGLAHSEPRMLRLPLNAAQPSHADFLGRSAAGVWTVLVEEQPNALGQTIFGTNEITGIELRINH